MTLESREALFPGSYRSALLLHSGISHKYAFILERKSADERCEKFVSKLSKKCASSSLFSLDDLELLAVYLAFDKDGGIVDLIERFGLIDQILDQMVQVMIAQHSSAADALPPIAGNLWVLLAAHNWATLTYEENYSLLEALVNDISATANSGRRSLSRRKSFSRGSNQDINWIRDLLQEGVCGCHGTSGWASLSLKQFLLQNSGDMRPVVDEIKAFVRTQLINLSSHSLYLISQLVEVSFIREELGTLELTPLLQKIENLEEDLASAFSACRIMCMIASEMSIPSIVQHATLALSSIPILLSSEELVAYWPVVSNLDAMVSLSTAKTITTFNASILVAYFASRLLKEGTEYMKAEARSVVNVILARITQSSDAEISADLDSFLASVPSLDERRSFHNAFGCMVKDDIHALCHQRFWVVWNQAHETNETSIGLTPPPSLNITLSPVKGESDDTLELDETRDEKGIDEIDDEQVPSSGAVNYLKQTNQALRVSILAEQRRSKELEEEQSRAVKMLASKDALLKDTLERLQMSLMKQEQLKDAGRTANEWAKKCEEDLSLARNEFEATKVDILLQNESFILENSRLEAEFTKTKMLVDSLEIKLEAEKSSNMDLMSDISVSRADCAQLKDDVVKLESDLGAERKNAEAAEEDKAKMKVYVENLEGDLAIEREKVYAQERRLRKAEKESSKHQEILRYINKMTTGGEGLSQTQTDDYGDDVDSENMQLNERRISSIQETLKSHLSQPLEDI